MDAKTPAEIVISEEELSDLAKAVSMLSPREQRVIGGRFGINRDQVETLDQLARHFGVTREMVRKIQKLALQKLRSRLQMPRGRWAESPASAGPENKIPDTGG